MEDRGFEPLTSAMRRQRSPAELVPHPFLTGLIIIEGFSYSQSIDDGFFGKVKQFMGKGYLDQCIINIIPINRGIFRFIRLMSTFEYEDDIDEV